MTGAHRQAGFTLLETLVAFAIATGSLVLLYQIHAGATATVSLAGEQTFVTELAESILAEIAAAEPADSLEQSGVAAEKYRWQATLEPYAGYGDEDANGTTADPVELLQLRRMTVEVRWESRDRPRSFELVTLRPRALPESSP